MEPLTKSLHALPHKQKKNNKRNTVPPEDIDPFPAFLPRGFHASMSRYSRTQPRLYLGKPEDAIRPTAAAFWTRYYLGKEDASSLNSIFIAKKHLIKPIIHVRIMSVTRLCYMHSRLPRRTRHHGFANDLTSCPRIMQTIGKTKCERLEWL